MLGKVIAIDGVDGCGKSTQIKLLTKLINNHFSRECVIPTFEPWDVEENPVGLRIRRILKHKEKAPTPEEFQYLFIQDRREHWRRVISPAKEKGYIVITDRERHVTYAHGTAFGVSLEKMIGWHKNLPKPDLFIYLRVSPNETLSRLKQRLKVQEEKAEYFEKKEKITKIVDAFDNLISSSALPNLIVIDGEGDIEEIQNRIWEGVKPILE